MTPEELLRAALAEATGHARPAPGALDRLRRRAHARQRAVRVRAASGVALASVLVVATPFALRARDGADPLPVVSPSPSPSATPAASPTTTPSPTPLRAQPAEFAAVTADRRLVLVSSRTGKTTHVVTRLPAMPVSLDVSPDGRTIYTDTFPPGFFESSEPRTPEECPAIHAIDVATGARRFVARGWSPRVSPDGADLAFVSCPHAGVRILHGRTFADDDFGYIGYVRWSLDGRALYVATAGDDLNSVMRLDLATARSFLDGAIVRSSWCCWVAPWRDRTLLDFSDWMNEDKDSHVFVGEDKEFGDARVLLTVPEPPSAFSDLEVGPAGEVLVQTSSYLYVWRGSGAPVRLGRSYPVVGW